MQDDRVEELLMELSTQISAVQKDVEYLKSEMHSNYIRSDESDEAVRELVEERTKYAANRQDAIKNDLQGQINLLNKCEELREAQFKAMDERIKALEGAGAKKVMSRWEKVKDYLFNILLILVVGAVLAWLGVILPQKPV